jgi:hypothetical protein
MLLAWLLIGSDAARGQPEELVDRIAVVLGEDIITAHEIAELQAYLRWRRDTARSEIARSAEGGLMREAYEEAVTRHLLLQKLRADPDLRLARSRASRSVAGKIAREGSKALGARLEPYGLSIERYAEIESLTVAIQDYVREKLRFAIVPTPVQIQQAIEKHAELKQQFEKLSDAGKDQVRAAIGRQLELQSFLEQYKKFVDELRLDVEVIQVGAPEGG